MRFVLSNRQYLMYYYYQKIGVLFVILAMIACNLKNHNNQIIQSKQEAKPLYIKSFIDSNEFYIIKGKYPIDNRDKDSLMYKFVMQETSQYQEEWKIGGEAYIAEKELTKEYPDHPKYHYEYNADFTTDESKKHGYITYKFISYTYTGGAHPNSAATNFTFGKEGHIGVGQVFDNQYDMMVSLTKLLAQKLVEQNGDNIIQEFMNEGLGLAYLNPDGSFNQKKSNSDGFNFASNFSVFSIKDDGIVFTMQHYAVGPYAAGMPEAFINWKELKPYLNSEFIAKNKL